MVEPTLATKRVNNERAIEPVPDMIEALRSYAREYRDGGYAAVDQERIRSGQAKLVRQSLLLIPDPARSVAPVSLRSWA